MTEPKPTSGDNNHHELHDLTSPSTHSLRIHPGRDPARRFPHPLSLDPSKRPPETPSPNGRLSPSEKPPYHPAPGRAFTIARFIVWALAQVLRIALEAGVANRIEAWTATQDATFRRRARINLAKSARKQAPAHQNQNTHKA